MGRQPPNTPVKYDRCIELGKPEREGQVILVDRMGKPYVTVKWDGVEQTMLCHSFGLQKI